MSAGREMTFGSIAPPPEDIPFGATVRPDEHPVRVELPMTKFLSTRTGDDEPQMVTSRASPNALVYLSTAQLARDVPRNDFILDNSVNFFQNVSRVGFVSSQIDNYFVPNVNPRNNTLTFSINADDVVTTHTITIPEQYLERDRYVPGALAGVGTIVPNGGLNEFMKALALQMSVASGVVFEVLPPDDPFALGLATYSIGTSDFIRTFRFDPTCPALTHGDTVFNFSTNPDFEFEQTVGPFGLQYTTHIDITSRVLTQYAKMRSVTSDSRSNVFARTRMGDYRDQGRTSYIASAQEQFSFSYKPDIIITAIDIQLYDSHGDLLYIPPVYNNNFNVQITLNAQM